MPDKNSFYSFSYNYSDNDPSSDIPEHNITHNIDGSADVEDLIDTFERFLLACGFKLPSNCRIDIVPEDMNKRVELDHTDTEEE